MPAPAETTKELTAENLQQLLDDQDLVTLRPLLKDLPPVGIITLLEDLNPAEQAIVYRLLPKDVALEVYETLPPRRRGDVIRGLQEPEIAELFASIDPDDRVWMLDELPAGVAPRLLRGLPPAERRTTAAVLGYPADSIGRRMSPEYVSVHADDTVATALAKVEANVDDAETVYTLPVVDNARKVVGVVGLRDLIGVAPDERVDKLMVEATTALATEDEEAAARRCASDGRLALPVVDSENRLVGILTIDDAVHILEREESEDAARQGGTEPLHRPYLSTPISQIVRSRIVWLLVLAVGATLTVRVLDSFESMIDEVTVLALFVPLLIGTGGNTGNQAATTVTRALSLDDVRPRDLLKVLAKELRVGLLLGSLLGLLGLTIAGLIYSWPVGIVIGLSLLSVCTVAASIGGLMPLIARSLKVDPAVFSNPFISTFVDATGLIIYFMIAKAVLGL